MVRNEGTVDVQVRLRALKSHASAVRRSHAYPTDQTGRQPPEWLRHRAGWSPCHLKGCVEWELARLTISVRPVANIDLPPSHYTVAEARDRHGIVQHLKIVVRFGFALLGSSRRAVVDSSPLLFRLPRACRRRDP